MSGDEVSTLKSLLTFKQKQLTLVESLDEIRDRTAHSDILQRMVAHICDLLEADVALLYLTDRWNSELRLHSTINNQPSSTVISSLIDSGLGEDLVGSQTIVTFNAASTGLENSWYTMGTGIEVAAEQPLGSIIFSRADRPFSAEDIELLKTAEMKLDSAIVQSYTQLDLEQRLKEIETIYRIDHIRDLELPFEEMLDKVLHELISIVGSEIGYVMLFDTRTSRLELHSSTVGDLLELPAIQEPLIKIGEEALNRSALVHQDKVSTHLQSVMCLPLIMNQERIGVLGVINGSNMTPFNSEDKQLLSAIGSQMDTAIFDSLQRRRLRKVLGRSVGPNIMDQLLANSEQDLLKGERRVVTVLYADIRQSTQLSTRLDPELLVAFMNYFLEEMTSTVIGHEGTIDKFIGDEVMALFNAPIHQADHALRAVHAGLAMQRRYEELRKMWRKLGVDAAGLGIGIATGELVVGEIGSTLKSEYTAIGQAANLGARIQGAALGGQVLISEKTYELVGDQVYAQHMSEFDFQGIKGLSSAYNVQGIVTGAPLLDAAGKVIEQSTNELSTLFNY